MFQFEITHSGQLQQTLCKDANQLVSLDLPVDIYYCFIPNFDTVVSVTDSNNSYVTCAWRFCSGTGRGGRK